MCNLCNFHFASTCHSLFYCAHARHVWKNGVYWALICKNKGGSFFDLLLEILQLMSDDSLRIFCASAWAVWGEVCKRKHDASLRISNFNVDWVHAFIHEFQCAQKSGSVHEERYEAVSSTLWRPPPLGHFWVDVDAGFDDAKGLFSVGAVI